MPTADLALDHILWGIADRDTGIAAFAELTGVEPAVGGSHPGFGTRNALAALEGDTYLEVLALDPAQAGQNGAWAKDIAGLAEPGLITFAVRTTDMAAARAAMEGAGIAMAAPNAMERTRPDGVHLAWETMHPATRRFGGLVPFLIDWRGSPHPSRSTPTGCRLVRLRATHPEPVALAAVYEALGLPVFVEAGSPGLHADLETPKGAVTLGPAAV